MRSQVQILALVGANILALSIYLGPCQLPALATISPPADVAIATETAEITAYEKKFFERSFDGEPNDRRLDRLESFIFGTKNTGAPTTRIGKIAAVVPLPTTSTTPPAGSGAGRSSASSTAGHNGAQNTNREEPLLDSPGNYPHITALEGEMLGQTYEGHSLNERLSRLETKAFGAPSKSKDFEERTDAIDQFQQAKRIPKPMTIGNPMGLGSLAEEAHRMDDADEDPGDIVRRQTIQQELAVAQKTTPPSHEERTLNRIAWCEQQIFGHASPELHLLQRLHNLNHELFPKDKEKDIQLMDRIDVIVKEVVLRQHPHQPST